MELSKLNQNPDNPRIVTDHKLAMLKQALLEYGDLGGFVFNRKTGRLIGGHQRQSVFPPDAKIIIEHESKKPTKVGTIAEGYVAFNGERFKYREVIWDEVKEKAAAIAANKGAGEWDRDKLDNIFKDLAAFDFDLSLTMFDDDDILDLQPKQPSKKKVEFEVDSDKPAKGLHAECPECGYKFKV